MADTNVPQLPSANDPKQMRRYPTKTKSKIIILISLLVFVLLLIGISLYLAFQKNKPEQSSQSASQLDLKNANTPVAEGSHIITDTPPPSDYSGGNNPSP